MYNPLFPPLSSFFYFAVFFSSFAYCYAICSPLRHFIFILPLSSSITFSSPFTYFYRPFSPSLLLYVLPLVFNLHHLLLDQVVFNLLPLFPLIFCSGFFIVFFLISYLSIILSFSPLPSPVA